MKGKTGAYYVETFGGYIIALIFAILTYKYVNPNMILCKSELFDKSIDVGGLTFGFLLTVLTLMLQTPFKVVESLKKNNKFSNLVKSNKEAVIVSLFWVALSLFLLSLKDENLNFYSVYLPKVLSSIYIFTTVLIVNKAYIFLKIFYIIILSE